MGLPGRHRDWHFRRLAFRVADMGRMEQMMAESANLAVLRIMGNMAKLRTLSNLRREVAILRKRDNCTGRPYDPKTP